MTILVDSNEYVHLYYADFILKHNDISSTLNSLKTDIFKKYVKTILENQASKRVAAAFGLSELPKELKDELFLNEDSLQAKLQQHVNSSSTALIRSFNNESSNTIQSLMGAGSKEQRNNIINSLFNDCKEQINPIVNQATDMLNYYIKVMEYQEIAALALAATGDERIEIKSILRAHNLEGINIAHLNKNVQEAIIQYHNIKRLNEKLRMLSSSKTKNEVIKSLDGLSSIYDKFGWQIKEIADAYALNLALSEGDKNQEKVIKAFQSGQVTGTLSGSDLLLTAKANIKLDPNLEKALADTDNKGYTRQIKADSFGIYVSPTGISGIIEISSKNRASSRGGTEKTLPVAIQTTTLKKVIDTAGRYAPLFNNSTHISFNLIAARPGQGILQNSKNYNETTLKNLWDSYKDNALQLSFLDYLSGSELRNTFGNNAMFFIVNDHVLSLYDLIQGIGKNSEIIKTYTKKHSASFNRQSKYNIKTAKSPQERNEHVLPYIYKILNKQLTIKIDIATLAALIK